MAICNPTTIIYGDPQNKNFHNYPTGTIIYDPKNAGFYTAVGGQSVAIGVNNNINSATSWVGKLPSGKNNKYSILPSQIIDDIIQNDLNTFIEDNIDDIDNNRFDSIYERILFQFGDENAKILIPELRKMLRESGIDDLKHMTQLPPYYCYHDLDTCRFEIPYHINEIFRSALEHMPSLDTIVWHTKHPNNLNPFPSYYSIYQILETDMAHYKPLTIDFPDHKYDKNWVKDLKRLLKYKKNHIFGELKNLRIKFNDKKKEIKVI